MARPPSRTHKLIAALACGLVLSPAGRLAWGEPAPTPTPAPAPDTPPDTPPDAAPAPDAPAPAGGGDDVLDFSEDEASAAAPAPAGPPRLFIHVYDDPGVPAEALAGTLRGARQAFSDDGRVVLMDLDAYLHDEEADPAGKTALSEADTAVDAATEQIRNLDLDTALVDVRRAVASYERYLPQLRARDGNLGRLTNAHRLLANASFLNQDQDAALASLRRMFVLRPDLVYRSALFPPQMEATVNAEQARIAGLPRGSLEIDSAPRRAELLINGQPAGEAPQTLEDLVPGPNYVTAILPGHPPTTRVVEVAPGGDAGGPSSVMLRLDSYPDDPIGRLAIARPELGQPGPMGPRLQAAADRLGRPELMLLVVAEGGASLNLTGYLYDTRSGKLIARERTESDSAYPGPPAEALARTLTRGVALDGGAAGIGEAPLPVVVDSGPHRGRLSRFRHSRWFWPVVGGTAGVVVLSVVIGVVSAQRDADARARFVVLQVLSSSF